MSKQHYFAIPTPCHENWDEMNADAKGRFCSNCKKVVRDFTKSEPLDALNNYVADKGKACGRFSLRQLATPILKPKMNFLRKFALACTMAFGTTLFAMDASAVPVLDQMKMDLVAGEDSMTTTFDYEGVVMAHDTREPMPFVNVTLSVNGVVKWGGVTDFDGKFSIKVDKKLLEGHGKLELQIASVGYDKYQEELPINSDLLKFRTFEMTDLEQIFMGVYIIIEEPDEESSEVRSNHIDLDDDN